MGQVKVGQCRNTSGKVLLSSVDPSPVVSCSSPHTLQTVAVYPVHSKPSAKVLTSYRSRCSEKGTTYVGVSHGGRTRVVPYLSTSRPGQQPAWIRCDVGLALDTFTSALAERMSSVSGLAKHDAVSVDACLNVVPDPTKNQTFVPCGKPHRAETASAYILAPRQAQYPSPGALRQQGQTKCGALETASLHGQRPSVSAFWESKATWQSTGGRIGAVCWYYSPTGKMLPPIT